MINKLTRADMKADEMVFLNELSYVTPKEFIQTHKIAETSCGVTILHHSEFLHTFGGVVAAAVSCSMFDGIQVNPFIVVDDYFMDIPPSIQKWIIYHELGHIHLGHLKVSALESQIKNATRTVLSWIGCTIKDEIEADRYAADHTSIVLSMRALQYLQDNASVLNVKAECATRKRNIMALTR